MSDRPIVARSAISRVRGIANTLLLIGLIVFVIGWTVHDRLFKVPPVAMAAIGLLLVTLFLVSSIAILVENRRIREETRE